MERALLSIDLTPRPIRCYADLWDRDIKTLNQWCQKGWVPGAYKHDSGEWWVKPIDLLGLDVSVLESADGKKGRNRGADKGSVLRTVDGGRQTRLRRAT